MVRWFGDCRYVQKNGQLKWLEAYQTMVLEEDFQRGDTQILKAHLEAHGSLEEEQVRLSHYLGSRFFILQSGCCSGFSRTRLAVANDTDISAHAQDFLFT